MIVCYQNIETDFRCYHGWQFNADEAEATLSNQVRNNLLDQEEQELFFEDLAGLPLTGFDNERILTDMQAIVDENPADIRSWRIGEAFAEVALENHLEVRFHWNELRDARNPRGNRTGADLVGFIEVNECVLFLFGEVKTSSENDQRPPQVMTGAGQMEAQLRDLYFNEDKRRILIRYLASKTRNLEEEHPFIIDYREALRSYYLPDHPNYQLTGVLIRDVEQHEDDIRESYTRLREVILAPTGIKLIACYLPITKEQWEGLINQVEE